MSYCSTTHLNYEYGSVNVAAWADLDGDANATKIADCIAWHISNADARIDDRLRRSDLSFGLPAALSDDTVPPTIRKIAVQLAGYGLSKGRGNRDYNEKGQPFSKYWMDYQDALLTLEQVATGLLKLENQP